MSVTSATARATRAIRPAERPRPARLRVVTPPPERRSPLPFAAACTALLVTSLLALLVLNISLSHGAYEVHDLQKEATRLGEREQELREQVAAQAAPAQLAVEARALGMVPSSSPAFIRLSDGKVLGTPQPAAEVPPPTVEVDSWQPPAAPGTAPVQPSTHAASRTPAGDSASVEGGGAVEGATDTSGSGASAQADAGDARVSATAAERGTAPRDAPVGDGAVIVRGAP